MLSKVGHLIHQLLAWRISSQLTAPLNLSNTIQVLGSFETFVSAAHLGLHNRQYLFQIFSSTLQQCVFQFEKCIFH